MRFPMVWRKAADDEIQHWKDEAGRQRVRAEKAEEDLKTEVAARRRATEMFTDLHDELERLRAQPAAVDEVRARQMADRIIQLRQGVAHARAEARIEKRRANHLQKELDNALGLPAGGPLSSAPWQPGYEAPKPDGAVSS